MNIGILLILIHRSRAAMWMCEHSTLISIKVLWVNRTEYRCSVIKYFSFASKSSFGTTY